jgi:hypothetical protein
MTAPERAKIQQTADNLRIPLYIREDGSVHQDPPGERIEPERRWANEAPHHGGPADMTPAAGT